MRQIKFRGKRIVLDEINEWVYGFLFKYETITNELRTEILVSCDEHGTMAKFDVVPETVGQFAEFLDNSKYKNELYEGDIIEEIGWQGDYYAVEFIDCAFYAISLKRHVPAGFRTKYVKLDELMDIQVVGNKYDNPELLEGDN